MNELATVDATAIDRDARARVMRFCRELMKLPQADVPTFHFFAPGVYVRQIRPVAGTAITGYIHMEACVMLVLAGKIAMTYGGETRTVEAPFTEECPPGTMKAALVLEDAVWSDAYANPDDERDIEKLEARLYAKSHREFKRRYKELK